MQSKEAIYLVQELVEKLRFKERNARLKMEESRTQAEAYMVCLSDAQDVLSKLEKEATNQ